MADSTVAVGITGILVSGVVGPSVAAVLARRSRSREFHREQVAARRNELRKLLDEAASLLASGPTNVRILHEQEVGIEVERARAWLSEVFPVGQRLQLWLPASHPVVISYDRVRERLVEAAQAGPKPGSDLILDQFEQERAAFLDRARDALLSPIPETGAGL
jgi:hypothetical protein